MSAFLTWFYDALAFVNLTVTSVFIGFFIREPWRKTAFGQSIMTLAVAVWLYSLLGVLLATFGDGYPWRDEIRTLARLLVCAAMSQRLYVLIREQRRDRLPT